MSSRLNKRLKAAFAPAALSLTMLFSGCGSLNGLSSSANDNQKSNDKAKAKTESTISWGKINRSYAQPYEYGAKQDKTLKKSDVRAVHIETSTLSILGLLLKPYSDPTSVLHRHGESCADITNQTADKMTNKDIDVRLIKEPAPLDEWYNNPTHKLTRSIFKHSDVVTISMGIPRRGPQNGTYSGSTINTMKEVAESDSLAARSKAILVQAAGNSGRDPYISIERETNDPYVRFDTRVKVGEAGIDKNGAYIRAHSSKSSPSFITLNPYSHGYKYPYVRNEELRERIQDHYNRRYDAKSEINRDLYNPEDSISIVPADARMKGKDILAQSLKLRADTVQSEYEPIDPKAVHPDFKNADFKYKEYLEKDSVWQAKHPNKVRKAMTEGIVSAAEAMKKQIGADKNGYVGGLDGTSFAAPYAGGLFAAMKEKYPNLNAHDLVSAALIASDPVERHQRQYMTPFGPISHFEDAKYKDNGRGLPFNNQVSGFGYLGAYKLDVVAKTLSEMVKDKDIGKTKEVRINSEMISFAQEDSTTRNVYEINIDEDAIALRTNLMMKFKDGADGTPPMIILANPAGEKIYLSPTRTRDAGDGISLATTNGHFGNYTKGTWKIIVPPGAVIESARLDIAGMEKGSAVDRYLEKHGADIPQAEKDKKQDAGAQSKNDKSVTADNAIEKIVTRQLPVYTVKTPHRDIKPITITAPKP